MNNITDEVKQIIIIRKDLKMRRGKECAQAAHAAMIFLLDAFQEASFKGYSAPMDRVKFTEPEVRWIYGAITKICLKVDSEEELLAIHEKALAAGLKSHVITDKGLTEFKGVETKTCLAIGPDFSSKIDPITSDLQLY